MPITDIEDAAPTTAKRMRVLLDARMATWTGVGRYTVGLARALAARDDVALSLVMAGDVESPVPHAQLDHVYSARAHPFSMGGSLELSRIVRDLGPDVTHCAHFLTPLPARHPLVVTVHDISPLVVPGIMPSAVKRSVYRRHIRRAIRVADRIIVDATFTVGELAREFPAAEGRITAIPIAADDFSAGPVPALPEQLARQVGVSYVLGMGSTRAHKDVPTLLRAFAALAPAHEGLRLILIGPDDPTYVAAHLPTDTPSEVLDRIVFAGRVTDGELRALYTGAEVFAFPSVYEGFGLPPLEAMSLGAPVVVADAASLPEVVADAALLVPPGDPVALSSAIARILADRELRDRLSNAGLARATELTWAATADATVRVYREVMSAAATGARR